MANPPRMTEEESAAFRARQRGRNVALLWVLVFLVALFFAISLAKMARF